MGLHFNAKSNSQSYFDSPLKSYLNELWKEELIEYSSDLKECPLSIPAYISQVKSVSGITVIAKSKWMNAIHVRGTQALIEIL
jgi:hypothetical protein